MRLIEIIFRSEQQPAIDTFLDKHEIIDSWSYSCNKDQHLLKLLVRDDDSKEIVENLEKESFHRLIILPVEGTLPNIETKKTEEENNISIGKFTSISKEELHEDIVNPINLSVNFILMVVLSSFVAGIGIIKDNTTILIGAMIVAPFLGPNTALAFGTTLGDVTIIKKAIKTGVIATIIALSISVVWGLTSYNSGVNIPDLEIQYEDILLAIICGFAGAISVLSGQGGTLVGVMVAAALLPPLMRSGLLLGAQDYSASINSFLIFGANIICLNISGIITFYFAGIRPSRWWDKEKAQKKTKTAFTFWLLALGILIAFVIYFKN